MFAFNLRSCCALFLLVSGVSAFGSGLRSGFDSDGFGDCRVVRTREVWCNGQRMHGAEADAIMREMNADFGFGFGRLGAGRAGRAGGGGGDRRHEREREHERARPSRADSFRNFFSRDRGRGRERGRFSESDSDSDSARSRRRGGRRHRHRDDSGTHTHFPSTFSGAGSDPDSGLHYGGDGGYGGGRRGYRERAYNHEPQPQPRRETRGTRPAPTRGNTGTDDLRQMGLMAFKLTNEERVRTGRPEQLWSGGMYDIAMEHSRYQAARHGISHDNWDYRADRMRDDLGVKQGSQKENVALNQGYDNPVERAVDGLIRSPGHYRNMLADNEYSTVAVYKTGSERNPMYFFTQLFGSCDDRGEASRRCSREIRGARI